MPSVFRRSAKNRSQAPAPAQSGLILVEVLIPLHCPYAPKNLCLSFEGWVSMPAGLFSQVLPEGGAASSKDNLSPLSDAVGGVDVADEKGDLDGSTADDDEV